MSLCRALEAPMGGGRARDGRVAQVLRTLIVIGLLVTCRPEPASAKQDQGREIYGTWRWVETVGDLLPARGTPQTCHCARMLILDPHRSYQFFLPDSSGGYLLARGGFSVRDDLNADGRPSGELRVSIAPSLDSTRHSLQTA